MSIRSASKAMRPQPTNSAGRWPPRCSQTLGGLYSRAPRLPGIKCGMALIALTVACTAGGAITQAPAPLAHAVPAPEVEYTYDVMVRRHYDFPNNDALAYGYGLCDKLRAGTTYRQLMGDVKRDVVPNDEASANYLVSYGVGMLCPAQLWQLRNSAAGYQPAAG